MHTENRLYKQITIIVLCCILSVSIIGKQTLKVNAVNYIGRGTKSDPYLVETSEQLQQMKNNLSAHYKLNNTIDLNNSAFTPIGYEGNPFTGSFVCETDNEGLPKYAIINLNISIIGVPNYADYVKDKNKWQASLFGATSNATITNIALISVNIKNTIEGKNSMNEDWSTNPGMNSMTASSLIGIANKTTVVGCSASGIIDSKSNQTAGLVGRSLNSTFERCYTQVSIKQTGRWGNGGFVGHLLEQSKVTECFSESNFITSQSSSVGFDAGKNTTAGFAGSGDTSTIENCYSTGNVGADGESFIGSEGQATMKYCYSTGIVSQTSKVISGNNNNNCFILNKSGCVQDDFTVADETKIKQSFSSNNLWETSGTLPKLKNVHVITDITKYVPRTINSLGTTNNESNSENDLQENNENDFQEDGENVTTKGMTGEEFADWISKLLKKAQGNNLTRDEAFEAIKANDYKSAMSSEEIQKLAQINPDINDNIKELLLKSKIYLVSSITQDIENLKDPDKLTEDDIKTVMNLYDDFNKLPEDFQSSINEESVKKLKECYDKAYEMMYVTVINQDTNSKNLNVLQIIICSVFGILDLAAIGGVVIIAFKIKSIIPKKVKQNRMEGSKN